MAALSSREKMRRLRARRRHEQRCASCNTGALNLHDGLCWDCKQHEDAGKPCETGCGRMVTRDVETPLCGICARVRAASEGRLVGLVYGERRKTIRTRVSAEIVVAHTLGFSHRLNGHGALYTGTLYRELRLDGDGEWVYAPSSRTRALWKSTPERP